MFQGTADGRFLAYDATTGAALWQTPVGSGVVAAPATWELDGRQYVTIAVGWGGVYGVLQRATERTGPGRVYTFAVGGRAEMPQTVSSDRVKLVEGVAYDKEQVAQGAGLYVSNCMFCHGVPGINNGGNLPNLGFSSAQTIEELDGILFSNVFAQSGMPNFEGKLTADDVTKIAAFIQGTADAIRQ